MGDKLNTFSDCKFKWELDENIFDVLYDDMKLENWFRKGGKTLQ